MKKEHIDYYDSPRMGLFSFMILAAIAIQII
jgi:hypothetical protein